MKNLRIGTKIIGTVLVILCLMGVAVAISLVKVSHVGDEVTEIGETIVPLKNATELALLEQGEEAQRFERLVRLGEKLSGAETALKEFNTTEQEFEAHSKQFDQAIKQAETIAVAQVREVLEIPQITKVPTAPRYMRGVVNVRGKAIPVVDLRLKFGLPPVPDTLQTRIIVIELELDGESTVVGGVADSVHEVIELESGEINPPPRIAMRWRTQLIQGMGRRGDEFILLLDINQVFASEDMALLASASVTAPPES